MFGFLDIMINIQPFQSIKSQLSPDMMKRYTQYGFDFYLIIKFLTSFGYNRFLTKCDTIFTVLGSISDEKYDVEKKTHLIWKMTNFVAFSSTKPYAAKYTCSPSKNFKLFYKDMCISWLSGTLFKINHDITSAEITFDSA